MYAPKRSSGYVGKSRLKDPSNASVRSKSMRSGMSRRSHLSKRKPTKRFNEELDVVSRKSKASYHPSKPSVKNYKPQVEAPVVEPNRETYKIEKEQKPKLPAQEPKNDEFEREEEQEEGEEEKKEEDERKEEQDLNDEIDSLYYGSCTESRRSDVSRRSQLTSATYISKLEKELQEEREAREKLAKELEEIKKISSEISSHLGLKNVMDNKN